MAILGGNSNLTRVPSHLKLTTDDVEMYINHHHHHDIQVSSNCFSKSIKLLYLPRRTKSDARTNLSRIHQHDCRPSVQSTVLLGGQTALTPMPRTHNLLGSYLGKLDESFGLFVACPAHHVHQRLLRDRIPWKKEQGRICQALGCQSNSNKATFSKLLMSTSYLVYGIKQI